METRDFLYHFTNIYLSEAVKETIFLENWKEGDFDFRFVDYADAYLKIKDKCFTRNIDILHTLISDKRNLVKKFHDVISAEFLEQLKMHPIKEGKTPDVIMNDIPLGDTINPNILKSFRDLEEQAIDYAIGGV